MNKNCLFRSKKLSHDSINLTFIGGVLCPLTGVLLSLIGILFRLIPINWCSDTGCFGLLWLLAHCCPLLVSWFSVLAHWCPLLISWFPVLAHCCPLQVDWLLVMDHWCPLLVYWFPVQARVHRCPRP